MYGVGSVVGLQHLHGGTEGWTDGHRYIGSDSESNGIL